ncbi:hypothetical protein HMPREF1870_02430 [Bacteroidales bacterium KA00344]|nr:hypothetical protein HMPREF1870_02430 [Bacteroidales bacterium KA00344]
MPQSNLDKTIVEPEIFILCIIFSLEDYESIISSMSLYRAVTAPSSFFYILLFQYLSHKVWYISISNTP